MIEKTFQILVKYHQGFLSGLSVTMLMFVIILVAGCLLGALIGWQSSKDKEGFGKITRVISFVLTGVPILVFLMWMHYPFQSLLGIVVPPFYTGTLTLAVINVFAVADLVRRMMDDFPEQYLIAAKVCGLTPRQTMLKIELPILFRQILPGLIVLQVTMLHATLFTSLISVEEIFRVAQRINASIYRPVEIYTALGVFFLLVSLPFNALAIYLRGKYTRNLSEK